ncbi:GntR family transcriptional regulator [Orrella sp. JC864]|uniref:GntR family transcriptional regulator n=1 Tax=Orrella sp. JC864 TaxID=3120298 RepID=UPI0030080622
MADSAATQVYKRLRRMILTGEIPAEQQLIETALAAQLKVSRTPIREALSLLKRDRLVIPVQTGGVITRDVVSELKDLLGVRKALETYAVKQAIDLITPGQVAELEYLCNESAIWTSEDVEPRAQHNSEFHQLLVAAARNQRLYQTWHECRTYFLIAQESYADQFEQFFDQHREILEAVKAKDKATAERLVNEHLDQSFAAFIDARATSRRPDFMKS